MKCRNMINDNIVFFGSQGIDEEGNKISANNNVEDDDAIVKTDKGAVTWFVNKISHKHEDWFGEIPEPKFHFSNEEKRVEIKILTEEEIKRINEEYLKTLVK